MSQAAVVNYATEPGSVELREVRQGELLEARTEFQVVAAPGAVAVIPI